MVRLLGLLRVFLRIWPARRVPEFARTQGMGLRHFLR
jgi:hypothetical protein